MELMTHPADLAAAGWLVDSTLPFERLVCFGPAGFEAAARLRFIPDPTGPDQDEADVDVAADHPSDLAQTALALHLLATHTAQTDDCFFCLWEGYPYAQLPTLPAESLVVVPHRRYALFRGPLADIDTFARDFGEGRDVAPPAFVWPADQAWCLACDVDPHWAGVGGAQAAIDSLVAAPHLDVVPARPEEPQPLYY